MDFLEYTVVSDAVDFPKSSRSQPTIFSTAWENPLYNLFLLRLETSVLCTLGTVLLCQLFDRS